MDQISVAQANAALDIVHEIATLLDTGLDKEEVAILIALVENGVNPEALAEVVKELRREAAALKAAEDPSTSL
ncbi:g1625 [Coccomyxa elongata]